MCFIMEATHNNMVIYTLIIWRKLPAIFQARGWFFFAGEEEGINEI